MARPQNTRVAAQQFECQRCRTVHLMVGVPGQTVTVKVVCECGGQIEITNTFPKEGD